jgi:hypothetical protein
MIFVQDAVVIEVKEIVLHTSYRKLVTAQQRHHAIFLRGNFERLHTRDELEGLGNTLVVRHLDYLSCRKGTERRLRSSMAGAFEVVAELGVVREAVMGVFGTIINDLGGPVPGFGDDPCLRHHPIGKWPDLTG